MEVRARAVGFRGENFDGLLVGAAGFVVLVQLKSALNCVDLGEMGGLAVAGYCALAAVLKSTVCSPDLGTDDHRLYPVELEDVHIFWHWISCTYWLLIVL